MPTFDFKCTACEQIFEKTLPFGSKGKPSCLHCGSKKTEKLLSMPGIAFKGSGFYKTDSRTKPVAPTKPATETKEKTPDVKPEKVPETPKKEPKSES